jgi:conjugative relaxase-like TrwC/TraI family protein
MKTTRWDENKSKELANRRVFYDFTFSPPKSVSVLALPANDRRIIDSHNRAVKAVVSELENFAGTRVHKGIQTSERLTGNVVCALFRHETSRALDPHLHTHCIMFNATHDSAESRWKALSNFEMLRARKLAENVYYHELAKDLSNYGYAIQNHPRGDFEIVGVSKEICSRFSKRHQEIDERIDQLLVDKPELARGNLKELRAQVAQAERSRKISGIESSALKALWDSQLTKEEKLSLETLRMQAGISTHAQNATPAEKCLDWAEAHLFDRRSVLHERELWSLALEHGRGGAFSIAELKSETAARDYVRDESLAGKLTNIETLQREWSVVCMASAGKGKYPPLNANYNVQSELSTEQREAVEKILNSRDFVTLFSGGAGTGKSYALKEVGVGLKRGGHPVCVIAPQRQQALDLRTDFDQTQTVAEFLARGKMETGCVVLVDEAGQIGGKQMHALLTLVKSNQGRVILSGDTRQHGAVEASDALRAIERYSGLRVATLTRIRRQDPKQAKTEAERERIRGYRTAVSQAQSGNYEESFNQLDRLGAIVECKTTDEQRERLVAAYLEIAQRNESTVVVSQTWGEIHEINERIRIGLRSADLIGKVAFTVPTVEPIDLTAAQKRDRRFHAPDSLLVFNRAVAGFKKGACGKLLSIAPAHLLIESCGKIRKVSAEDVDKFNVCRTTEMQLAKGDRLQLKANVKSLNGKEVVNGELVTFEKIDTKGNIYLKDGRTLPKEYRQFVRGYAVTSYGSQGKTVANVLFSDSAVKAATNHQQWLVSISRGKRSIKIFTLNKAELRENISRSGDRELAIEMAERTVTNPGKTEQPIRRYIENLIRNRRESEVERQETNKWTSELNWKKTQSPKTGMRI